MGTKRGLRARVLALALVPVVAAGCGVGCGDKNPPIHLNWSGKVVLSADSPAAARVINVDIPPTAGLLVTNLDFNWAEEGGTVEEPWVSIVDVTGGTSTYVRPWDSRVGYASLTDACNYGCNRSYAYLFRWDSPVVGKTRTIDVAATLRIYSAGGADECEGVVGTVEATLTEDVSHRFDGKPRMVSARAVGDLQLPLEGAEASATAHLHASKALMARKAVYPAVARVFAGFTPDYTYSTSITVGSTPALSDGGVPAQAEWQPFCDLDADCVLPIEFSHSFGPASAPSGATGAAAFRKVQWWVEARIELFSATGSLPDGTLTLTQP
jgi:hypothetical protein